MSNATIARRRGQCPPWSRQRSSAADATGRRRTTPSRPSPTARRSSSRVRPRPPGGSGRWTSRSGSTPTPTGCARMPGTSSGPRTSPYSSRSTPGSWVRPPRAPGGSAGPSGCSSGLPESAAHGYPLYLGTAALMGGDLLVAEASARRMQELGRRHDDPTFVALGVYFEGRVRIKQARVADGLALLDEAMVAALSDELGPLWTGAIYCGLMDACNELRDLRRASEWTEATRRGPTRSRWRRSLRASAGCTAPSCSSTAESGTRPNSEALGACEDMVGIDVFAVADAYYEVGEVRRLRGDLDGAEQAYHAGTRLRPRPAAGHRAAAAGAGPRPRRVVVDRRGARGQHRKPPGARRAPCGAGRHRSDRGRSRPRRGVGAGGLRHGGDIRQRRAAADGHRCRGAVLLAQGRTVESIGALRSAFNAWNGLDVPFESARARLLLAQAYSELGDADAAAREQAVAQACFDQLGVMRPQQPRLARSDPSGGGGDQAARLGEEQPRDRRRTVPEPEDRGAAPLEHLHEDRRHLALGRDGVRLRQRADGRTTHA